MQILTNDNLKVNLASTKVIQITYKHYIIIQTFITKLQLFSQKITQRNIYVVFYNNTAAVDCNLHNYS